MRKSLWRGRQGIAAAHALFSIYFHEVNFRLGEKHGQNLLHRTHAHARNAGWTPPPNVPHFGASKLCSKNRGPEPIASNEPAVGKNEEAQILNPDEVAAAEERWVAEGIVDAGLVDDSASMAAERDDASSAHSISSHDDWAAPTLDPALPHLTAARRIIVPPDGFCFYHALAYALRAVNVGATWEDVQNGVIDELIENEHLYHVNYEDDAWMRNVL